MCMHGHDWCLSHFRSKRSPWVVASLLREFILPRTHHPTHSSPPRAHHPTRSSPHALIPPHTHHPTHRPSAFLRFVDSQHSSRARLLPRWVPLRLGVITHACAHGCKRCRIRWGLTRMKECIVELRVHSSSGDRTKMNESSPEEMHTPKKHKKKIDGHRAPPLSHGLEEMHAAGHGEGARAVRVGRAVAHRLRHRRALGFPPRTTNHTPRCVTDWGVCECVTEWGL